MDQEKIGRFLKQLRQENGLTQEQLAEQLGINSRTVSRWETARTMPDFALLVELGRRYGVTVDELLNGERRENGMMNREEETMKKVVDYTEQEKQLLARQLNRCFMAGAALLLAAILLREAHAEGTLWLAVTGFGQGGALGMLLVGTLMTSRLGPRLLAAKQKLLQKIWRT